MILFQPYTWKFPCSIYSNGMVKLQEYKCFCSSLIHGNFHGCTIGVVKLQEYKLFVSALYAQLVMAGRRTLIALIALWIFLYFMPSTCPAISPNSPGNFILPHSTNRKVFSRRSSCLRHEIVKQTKHSSCVVKERLRLYKRWPCSTYILNRVN